MVHTSAVIFAAIALNVSSVLAAPVVRPFFGDLDARSAATKLFARGGCLSGMAGRGQEPQQRSTHMNAWIECAQNELFWDEHHTSPPHIVPPVDYKPASSDESSPRSQKSDGSVSGSPKTELAAQIAGESDGSVPGSPRTKLAAHIAGNPLAKKTVHAKKKDYRMELADQFQDGPSRRGHTGVIPAKRDQGNLPPRLPQDLPTLLGIHLDDRYSMDGKFNA